MALRFKRGMGRTVAEDVVCRSEVFGGFFNPACWSALELSAVAPPGAPTGDVLTVPPASGVDAQATVDALVNQQLIDQQTLNAQGVQGSLVDSLASGVVSAGSAVAGAFPWLWVGLGGLGLFALVAIGGGSPRRYGR